MNNLRITAIHEAAHAVVALRLGLVFDHVTTVPDEDAETDGAMHWTDLQSAGDLEIAPAADAIVLLAGPFAEARVTESSLHEVLADDPAGEDREALATLGLDDEEFVAASREALALVEEDWAAIERVADALLERETLDFAEVGELLAAIDD
jgi:ATP-dependent Zn protease